MQQNADVNEKKNSANSLALRLSGLIVKARYVIFILFAIASVYCVRSLGKVKVNPDFRVFLPKDSETRRGIAAMSGEFPSFAGAKVMIENIGYK